MDSKKGGTSLLDSLIASGGLHVNDDKIIVVLNSVEKVNGLIIDPGFQSHEGTVVLSGTDKFLIGDRVWWTKTAFVEHLPLGPKEAYFVINPRDIVICKRNVNELS